MPLQKAEPSAVRGKPCLNYSLDRAILGTVAEDLAPAESGGVRLLGGTLKERTSAKNNVPLTSILPIAISFLSQV